MRDVEAVVKRFKTELHNCVGFIQEPKQLKESVKQLYKKYAQGDTVRLTSASRQIPFQPNKILSCLFLIYS